VLRVPRVDRVLRARAPEELRRLATETLPDRSADALALRFVRDSELVEIGHAVLLGEDRGRAIGLREVDATGLLLLEVGVVELLAEALLQQRAQARLIDRREVVVPEHFLAAPHQ